MLSRSGDSWHDYSSSLLPVGADEEWALTPRARRGSPKERVERACAELHAAIAFAERKPTPDNIMALAKVVDAAPRARVPAALFMKGRQVLANRAEEEKRMANVRRDLHRLLRRADTHRGVLCEEQRSDDDKDYDEVTSRGFGPDGASQTSGFQEDRLLKALMQALDSAQKFGVEEPLVEEANKVVDDILKAKQSDRKVCVKLRRLLGLKDPQEMRQRLQNLCQHNVVRGEASILVEKVRAKAGKLEQVAQEQEWLEFECGRAAAKQDGQRLAQLIDQATALGLRMPPHMLALCHNLEDRSRLSRTASDHQFSAATGSVPPTPRRAEKLRRSVEAAETQLAASEENPNLEGIELCKMAIEEVRRCRASNQTLVHLEARLAVIEKNHVSRLRKEERMVDLLRDVERYVLQGLPVQDGLVQELRRAIHEAQKYGLQLSLREAAQGLMKKCLAIQAFDMQKHSAEERLRKALDANAAAELPALRKVIEDCKACGICTLHAERVVREGNAMKERCKQAEAELEEVLNSKSTANSTQRLEAALEQAKAAGVSSDRLQAGVNQLDKIQQHSRQCTQLAGHFRRLLPNLTQRPWLFLQALDKANELKPWSLELDRAISAAQAKVKEAEAVAAASRAERARSAGAKVASMECSSRQGTARAHKSPRLQPLPVNSGSSLK